jgi:hypothetical protein
MRANQQQQHCRAAAARDGIVSGRLMQGFISMLATAFLTILSLKARWRTCSVRPHEKLA